MSQKPTDNVIPFPGRAKSVAPTAEPLADVLSIVSAMTKEAQPTPAPTPARRQSINGNYNIQQNQGHVTEQVIEGDNNVQIAGDVLINTKKTVRNVVQPTAAHIDEATAYQVSERIKELAELEVKAGKPFNIQKWWAKLKKQFQVTSYKLIPAGSKEAAFAWLDKQRVLLRPKLRRTDNDTWRNSHYKGIWARAHERGLSKPDVYALASAKLGKPVASLSKLGERDLKAFYQYFMGR